MEKTAKRNRARMRMVLAALLACALAAGPLLQYTPLALGKEGAGTENPASGVSVGGEADESGTETEASDDGFAPNPGIIANGGEASTPQAPSSVSPLEAASNSQGMQLATPAPTNLFTINAAGTIIGFAYNSTDPIVDLDIPGVINGITVTAIGDNVFTGCGLKSVVIPETVKKLGQNSFKNNSQLKTVTFAGNSQLQTIAPEAFCNCSSLDGIVLPNGVTAIQTSAFRDCTSLTSITIPSGVRVLPGSAFYNCSNLSSVTLQEGLESIGSSAFFNCVALTEIILPTSLTTIEGSAFQSCPLSTISIPANVTSIGANALSRAAIINLPNHYPDEITGKPWGSGTQYIYWKTDTNSCFDVKPDGNGGVVIVGLKPPAHDEALGGCGHPTWHQSGQGDVVIPKEIGGKPTTGLLSAAFMNNSNIKTVAFENGCVITVIPKSAFYYCQNLVSVSIPDTITEIGETAFFQCGKLNTVTIPASVEIVGSRAFDASGLKSITIMGGGVLSVANNAFPSGQNLKDIFIQERNYDGVAGQPWAAQYAKVTWKDNAYPPQVIIDANGWHYNRVTDKLVQYAGPTGSGVDVVVPKKINYEGVEYDIKNPLSGTYLMNKVFRTITVAEGYSDLAYRMCYGATAEQVVLPSTLTSLADQVFQNSKIKSINLPHGLTAIGTETFAGCTQLVQIDNFLPSTLQKIAIRAFNGVPLRINLDNPDEASKLFPPSLVSIREEAFNGCQITGVLTIPARITTLGAGAFSNNPGITAIYVDEYRSDSSIKDTQPWMTDRVLTVFYKGERPECSHIAAAAPNLPFSIVDFTTWLGQNKSNKYVTSVAGIWIADGTLTEFPASGATRLFNDAADGEGQGKVTKGSILLPDGTYTFFVSTPLMTKSQVPDPTQYVPYTITLSTSVTLPIDASDYTVKSSELAGLTEASAIQKAAASSHDPYSGNESSYSMAAMDMNKIKALSSHNESTQVTIRAGYNGVYNHNGVDYPYTLSASKEVTVTLAAAYAVDYNLNYVHPNPIYFSHADVIHGQTITVDFNLNPPADPTRPGHTFEGWYKEAACLNAWNFDSDTVTSNIVLYAKWVEVPQRTLAIEAQDFSMSLAEAQAHHAKSPADQLAEITIRGQAHAYWLNPMEPVDITFVRVKPSTGDGKSIDAIIGTYHVTYYASSNGRDVETTVLCTVYGNTSARGGIAGSDFTYNIAGGPLSEGQVRSFGGITVYDQAYAVTGELGRINQDDLAALNNRITAGELGPFPVRFSNAVGDEVTIIVTLVATPGGGGGTPIYAFVNPVVQIMQGIAATATGQPTMIAEGETPLAQGQWCWVHFYIIAFGLLTVLYTAGVVARRRKFTSDLGRYEDDILKGSDALDYGEETTRFRAGQGIGM